MDYHYELRTVTLVNGNVIKFKKDPRFGRWTMNLEQGQLPAHLQGSYLTYEAAVGAANQYYNNDQSRWKRRHQKSKEEKAALNGTASGNGSN